MIELKGIRKVFNPGTSSETVAINNLHLKLESGDFITVIGGNGAGKSTLLNIVSGSYEADEGLILLNNNDVSRLPEFKRAPLMRFKTSKPLTFGSMMSRMIKSY